MTDSLLWRRLQRGCRAEGRLGPGRDHQEDAGREGPEAVGFRFPQVVRSGRQEILHDVD